MKAAKIWGWVLPAAGFVALMAAAAFGIESGGMDTLVKCLVVGGVLCLAAAGVLLREDIVRFLRKPATWEAANIAVLCVAGLAIWATANFIVRVSINYVPARIIRADLTPSKRYTLSDETLTALAKLTDKVYLAAIYDDGNRQAAAQARQIADLAEEYESAARNVVFTRYNIDRQSARIVGLASQLGLNVDADWRNAVLVYDAKGKRSKLVRRSDLYRRIPAAYRGAERVASTFMGEPVLTSAILEVTSQKQPKLYFTTGHGEAAIDSAQREGLSVLVERLKRLNYSVDQLVLATHESVPKDCDVLAVVGPTKPFSDRETALLDSYIRRGGRLFLCIDNASRSQARPSSAGFKAFLAKWQIDLGDQWIYDHASSMPANPDFIVVKSFPYHPITQKMAGLLASFPPGVRPVEPTEQDGKLAARTLLRTSDMAWGETNLADPRGARYDSGADEPGPLSFGVAVGPHETPTGPPAPGGAPRLVVIGSGRFVENALAVVAPANFDLAVNCIRWLAGQKELISIAPKDPKYHFYSLEKKQGRRIVMITLLGLPLVVIVLGIAVWLARRK